MYGSLTRALTFPTTFVYILLIMYATLYMVVSIRLQRSHNPLYLLVVGQCYEIVTAYHAVYSVDEILMLHCSMYMY